MILSIPIQVFLSKRTVLSHSDRKDQTLYDVARPNNEGFLFYDMYQFTGSKKYKDAFISLCNSLIEKQDAFGLWMHFMPNHYEVSTFHPRFNLWYAESLIKGYALNKNPLYLAAAQKNRRPVSQSSAKRRHDLLQELFKTDLSIQDPFVDPPLLLLDCS